MAAIDEGRDAHQTGVKARKCPYPDEPRRAAWTRGWYESERERNPYAPAVLPVAKAE